MNYREQARWEIGHRHLSVLFGANHTMKSVILFFIYFIFYENKTWLCVLHRLGSVQCLLVILEASGKV